MTPEEQIKDLQTQLDELRSYLYLLEEITDATENVPDKIAYKGYVAERLSPSSNRYRVFKAGRVVEMREVTFVAAVTAIWRDMRSH